jgi:N-acetylmuramoyl-L-alanine amidase
MIRVVGISAGHGGSHRGARSSDGSIIEKAINLQTAQRVAQQLSGISWIEPRLIRRWDETLTFTERGHRANEMLADLVVAIHHDNLPSNRLAHGLSCYHKHNDKRMRSTASWMVNSSPLQLRGGRVVDAYNDPDRDDDDWLERPQTVLNAYSQDVVLVECCYLSNAGDLAFLALPHSTDLIASSIVSGVVRYFQIKQLGG